MFYLTFSILCQVTSCFALKAHIFPHTTLGRHPINNVHHHHHAKILRKESVSLRGGNSDTSIEGITSSSNDTRNNSLSTNGGGTKLPPSQPTLQDLINFALPCLGLWISGPLLSLVDTGAIGLTAKPGQGATELGALGPATTFIDGATYLFAFLNVATTNLFASAMARNEDENKRKLAGDGVVRTAMKISIICGFSIMTLLLTKGQSLLKLYIGEAASGKVLAPATKYVKF